MQTPSILKSGSRYPLVTLGVAVLAFVVAAALRSVPTADNFSDPSNGLMRIIDGPLAMLITVSSFVVFAGLWKIYPETVLGQGALRGAIALLVVLNLATWGVALWLR